MKTSHTTYSNFAKRVIILLVVLTTIGISSAWGETVTLTDMGATLGTSVNPSVNTATVNTYDIYYRYCKKQSNSGSHAMLLDKSYGAFIANKTPMPGKITSVTIYALTGAGSASYHCAFSATERNTLYTDNGLTQSMSGGSSKTYTCSLDNARYFCISLGSGSANNGQVWKVEIQYEVLTGTKHTVNWFVDGELYSTQTDVAGVALNIPKLTKMNCDAQKVFVGWTTKTKYANATVAPDDLITSTEMSIPVGGANYYAVFATANPGGNNLRTVTLSPPDVENKSYEIGTIDDSEQNTWTYHATIQNQFKVLCFGLNTDQQNYNIGSPEFGGYVKSISFRAYTAGSNRKFYFCSSNSTPQPSSGNLGEVSLTQNKIFATTQTINFTQDVQQFYIYASGGSFITDISVTYASNYSDYTTNCTNKTFSVTYEANDAESGSAPVDPKSPYDNGSNVIVLDNTGNLARSGFTFNGWNTERDGSGTPYDAGSTFVITEDVTLYAQWKARPLTNYRTSCSYTVTWQANGGQWSDGATEDIEEEYNVGETITPPTDPTRDGYTFAGWDPEVPATMPAEDQTFTAIWENCRWVETTTIEDGDEMVFIMVDNKESKSYAMDNSTATSSHPLAVEITNMNIFAIGNVPNNIIWNIHRDANGIVFYSKSVADSHIFCTNSYVRVGVSASGKTFTLYNGYLKNLSHGYLAVATGANTPYWQHYDDESTNLANQTLKLYKRVCIEEDQHWVTWDANGGMFADGSATKTDFFTVGATITHPANPTREGYTFTGWAPTTNTMPNEDIALVAQWQVNSYTVTWNANGGKFGNETSVEQSYPYGATITAPADPTRTGYTFAGWDPAPAATMPASHLTYNAQWNCTSPTDIKINGAYIVFPGETIELTVTGNNIADDATYIWKKGDQIIAGQTTATLTIPNCVVGDAANYKCVVTNGACSAENNFTVKMYRLRGLTDPENNWTTDFVFSKAEGKTATYEITLNGERSYKFKVHDGSAYYGNNEGGDNPNPTMTHDNCTNWTMQENKGYNVILQTTITGVYTFVLNYTDESNPTISVIYPKKKIIYLNPNDKWSNDNPAYTVYSWGTAEDAYTPMELADCNGKVYMAEIDAAHTQVIFIRYTTFVTSFNSYWNRTNDLSLVAENPQFKITTWNSGDWIDGKETSDGEWEPYTPYYSISYDMNGHGQSIGDICIKKDDIWIAPDDPSEVGYTFLGWRRPAETGDNTLYKKGVTGFPVVSDEELTAQWSFSMEYAITGTANVTSAVGQTIKATTPLQLAVSNMPVGTKVTISAPNITFYDEAGNVITELATKYNPESFTLTAAYTPIVANTTEQPTITLSVLGNEKTFDGLISARSLPETFAIVAKVGNIWYALPSQGLNSTDDLMGYAIEVDNQDDPTLVTNVPANADWSLRQVYAASHNDAQKDRFKLNGANIMFENNASPAKMLNASASKNYLLTNAEYDNYKTSDNQGLYEWTPTTTDLETYQLTNAYRTDRKLSIDILTRFGVYAGEITNMRFLPIQNRYTPAALQVVEWKENSVVVMYTGDPSQTATLAINGTEQVGTTTLNSVQKDIAIYELPANGIANKATQRLCITIGTSKKWLTIPYIINGSQTAADVLNSTSTTKAVAAVTDVVVLDGATLTAAGNKNDKYTFRTIHVYGGGKLVVPASATEGLGIYSLILRSGTVENGTYTNSYPQLVMNGKYSNTSGIYLDYITTYERYYALSVPYPVKTKNIKYPADIYGDNLKSGNTASFALQYYDGAARATGASGWKDFDESGDDPTLTPYQGYTFWGAPRKVSVNGGTAQRPKFGIHRIQLTGVGADDLLKSENEDKTINITAYPANRPNDMGWNFLGNPYLAQYGGLSASDEDVQVGLLEQEMVDGRWTGGWKHTGNLRYITITTDGQTYTPVEVDEATFSPFNTFFIQAAKDGALQFASASRAQNAPARHYAAQQETVKEITTGIILTGNDQTDRTGLLIADNFTEEYDFNADLSKFENSGINLYTIGKDGKLAFMAINQTLAEQPIPLGYGAPAEGLYTIAFDEDRYNATDISALYLIDYDSNEKTNLLHTDYSFVTAAGTNNERFALQVAFAPENATNIEWVGDATVQVGVEGNTLMLNNLPTDAAVHVFDALGRLMYHAPTVPTEMQLTLPTGYYLVRIADKQNAVVIKTVIP